MILASPFQGGVGRHPLVIVLLDHRQDGQHLVVVDVLAPVGDDFPLRDIVLEETPVANGQLLEEGVEPVPVIRAQGPQPDLGAILELDLLGVLGKIDHV
jgi:hypothetical protein